MNRTQIKELLLQSLEHERGGVEVYETALQCAVSENLRQEWLQDLEQTRHHVQIMERVCRKLDIDADEPTPARAVMHELGASLVAVMKAGQAAGDLVGAQVVACECVALAETQDFADWKLLCQCAKALDGLDESTLIEAVAEADDELPQPANTRGQLPRRGPRTIRQ